MFVRSGGPSKVPSSLVAAIRDWRAQRPRGAVKTGHPRAVENRPGVGGHFQNRPVGLPSA